MISHHPLGSTERFWEEMAASERRRDALRKLRAAEQASQQVAPLAAAHIDPVGEDAPIYASAENSGGASPAGVFDRLTADQERKRQLQQQREQERQAREAGALNGLFQPRVDPVSAATVAAQRALGADGQVGAALPVEHRLLQAAHAADARRAVRMAERERQLEAELAPQPRPTADAGLRADSDVAPLWQRVEAVCAATRGKREERAVAQLQRDCTFRPEINRVSAATAQALLDAMPLVEVPVGGADATAGGVPPRPRVVDPHDVVARLHHVSVAQRQLAQQELESDAALRDARTAPFHPAVDPRSAQLAMRHALEHGGGAVHLRQERLDHLRQERIAVLQAAHARADAARPSKVLPAGHLQQLAERLYKQREEQAARRAELASQAKERFRPTVLPESERMLRAKFIGRDVAPVLQRMEHDQRARDAKRRAASATTAPVAAPLASADVMSPERLQRFLLQQDAHSRRVSERTRLLRQRQEAEALAGCSFRPSVVSGTDGSTVPGNPVDECVRGMDAVRARIARAARLKEEKAMREQQAFGVRAASQPPTITVPRPCNLSTAQVARRRDAAGASPAKPTVVEVLTHPPAEFRPVDVRPASPPMSLSPASEYPANGGRMEAAAHSLGRDVIDTEYEATTTASSSDPHPHEWRRRTLSPASRDGGSSIGKGVGRSQAGGHGSGMVHGQSTGRRRPSIQTSHDPSSPDSQSYSDASSSSSSDSQRGRYELAWWQRPLPDAGLLSPTLLADYSDLLSKPASVPAMSTAAAAKPTPPPSGTVSTTSGKPPPAPPRRVGSMSHQRAPSGRGHASAGRASALDDAIRRYLKADHVSNR